MRLQALGQPLDHGGQSGLFRTVGDPLVVDALRTLGDLLRDGHIQHGELLKDGAEQRIILSAVKRPDIPSVQQHRALHGV